MDKFDECNISGMSEERGGRYIINKILYSFTLAMHLCF